MNPLDWEDPTAFGIPVGWPSDQPEMKHDNKPL